MAPRRAQFLLCCLAASNLPWEAAAISGTGLRGSALGASSTEVASVGAARGGMRPEVAATLFANVSRQWVKTRLFALSMAVADAEASEDQVVESCGKVASAIIFAADGDAMRVLSYMQTVCTRSSLAKQDRQLCNTFGANLVRTMRGDRNWNRQLDPSVFCHSFYQGTLATVAKKEREQERLVHLHAKIEQASSQTTHYQEGRILKAFGSSKLRAAAKNAAARSSTEKTTPEVPAGLMPSAAKLTGTAAQSPQAVAPAASKAEFPVEQPIFFGGNSSENVTVKKQNTTNKELQKVVAVPSSTFGDTVAVADIAGSDEREKKEPSWFWRQENSSAAEAAGGFGADGSADGGSSLAAAPAAAAPLTTVVNGNSGIAEQVDSKVNFSTMPEVHHSVAIQGDEAMDATGTIIKGVAGPIVAATGNLSIAGSMEVDDTAHSFNATKDVENMTDSTAPLTAAGPGSAPETAHSAVDNKTANVTHSDVTATNVTALDMSNASAKGNEKA